MKKYILFPLLALPTCLFAQAFSSGLTSEKKPWTSPVSISAEDYKFIVLPDRTGGPETYAFDRAIEEINRIAPDFVITSGDLIDGYVSDISWSEPQWNDVMQRLSKLEAPFFFVGGNHDLSNKAQSEDFARRFGATYYSFNVGKDLFLVLDTESRSPMAEEQVRFFTDAIASFNGRHIYVFMHTPLWYPQNRGGFERIDEALQGHQYTVFSGHTHWYYMEERNGMEYYVVATAGGDSQLRGYNVGEFDHYLLVSAREGKPAIANLPLGAMLPNDIVSKETKPLVDWMLGSKYVSVPQIELSEASPAEFEFEIEFKNPNDVPMKATAAMPSSGGLRFSPECIDETLPAGAQKAISVKVENPGRLPVGKLELETACGYTLNGSDESASAKTVLLTDYVHELSKGTFVREECKDPYYIKESWDWHGTDDGWFNFEVALKGNKVIISVQLHDDTLVESQEQEKPQDKVDIYLTSGGKEYSYTLKSDGEIQIPVKSIKDKTFGLNIAFTDSDDPKNTKPSVLWWRDKGKEAKFIITE